MNQLINKIGIDKIAHFSLGYLIADIGYFFTWSGLFSFVLVFVLATMKELADDNADFWDWLCGLSGAIMAVAVNTI